MHRSLFLLVCGVVLVLGLAGVWWWNPSEDEPNTEFDETSAVGAVPATEPTPLHGEAESPDVPDPNQREPGGAGRLLAERVPIESDGGLISGANVLDALSPYVAVAFQSPRVRGLFVRASFKLPEGTEDDVLGVDLIRIVGEGEFQIEERGGHYWIGQPQFDED